MSDSSPELRGRRVLRARYLLRILPQPAERPPADLFFAGQIGLPVMDRFEVIRKGAGVNQNRAFGNLRFRFDAVRRMEAAAGGPRRVQNLDPAQTAAAIIRAPVLTEEHALCTAFLNVRLTHFLSAPLFARAQHDYTNSTGAADIGTAQGLEGKGMDKVCLQGIGVYGHHGYSDEEREVGQTLEVDVEIRLDLRHAGRTDNLEYTVDYSSVYATVYETVSGGRHKLLEHLAEDLARQILSAEPAASILVRVRKPNPPVGGICAFSYVEIERTREDLNA